VPPKGAPCHGIIGILVNPALYRYGTKDEVVRTVCDETVRERILGYSLCAA